jgi:pilus assembly protein Flp/PilA
VLTSSSAARRVSDRQRRDETGASAVEYGLLIAGIAALIVIAVFAFGGGVKTLFNNTCTTVGSAAHAGTC